MKKASHLTETKKHESQTEEMSYFAERIVGKKIFVDGIRYYVKWVGYPDEENTWEPPEHLKDAKKLIAQYESELVFEETLNKLRNDIRPEKTLEEDTDDSSMENSPNKRGDNLIVEDILGAIDTDNEVKFLVKGRKNNTEVQSLIPLKYLRFTHPQLVIQFYKKHSEWVNSVDTSI